MLLRFSGHIDSATSALARCLVRWPNFVDAAVVLDNLRRQIPSQPVATPSSAQVRTPIHTRGIGQWRRYAQPLAPLQATLESGD